jgi:DNA polymerase III delta subunit
MIIVIHGDDIASSRKYLQSIKEKSSESKTIFGSAIDMTTLAQLFESDNLFTPSQTFFIEELLTKKKQAGDLDALLAYINKQASEHEIYLWESKEVGRTMLNKLPNAKNLSYKLPQSLFQFLDSLSPHNKNVTLKLFHHTLNTTEPELVFFMLTRHFRLMLGVYDNETHIDEVKKMAPWQMTKIKKQASQFTKEALATAMRALHAIDLEQKTGTAPLSLSASIDIFLMNL